MSRAPALVLTPRTPWPLDDGGRVGLWQCLEAVARSRPTVLATLELEADRRHAAPDAVRELGIEVVRVPHRFPPAWAAAWEGLTGRWPFTIARFRNRQFDRTLRRLVAERQPAFAFVNHLPLATYHDALDGTVTVLRQHNLEWRWLRRYADSGIGFAAARYARHQAGRLQRAEARLCEAMDLVLAIQDDEAREMRDMAPRARVEVVPLGVDFPHRPARRPLQPPVVLLVGAYDRPPNRDGARRFVVEGWPRVRARVPAARLRIVGRSIPDDLAALARARGAEPVGFVPDLSVEHANASVMVIPLWAGAGVRVKLVEALAAELPVVSTPIGAEGLGLVPGRHHLEASTPIGLADGVVRLLEQPEQAAAMAAAARTFGEARFGRDAVQRRLVALCEEAAAGRAKASR